MPSGNAGREMRGPGRPPKLQQSAVLEAAVALADEEGLEAVTMQRLAKRLGVGTMTMYGYFDSKRALYDGMLKCVLDQLPPAIPADTPWREMLEFNGHALRDCFIRHPGVVPLLWDPDTTAEGGWYELVHGIQTLARAGLPLTEATHAYFALINLTVGAIEWETTHLLPDEGETYADELRATLAKSRNLPRDLIFDLPEAFTTLSPREQFSLRLSFLLDGVECRLQRRAAEAGD